MVESLQEYEEGHGDDSVRLCRDDVCTPFALLVLHLFIQDFVAISSIYSSMSLSNFFLHSLRLRLCQVCEMQLLTSRAKLRQTLRRLVVDEFPGCGISCSCSTQPRVQCRRHVSQWSPKPLKI